MTASPSPLRGIGLMILAMASFACMNTAIRELSTTMPSPQMVFLRNIASLVMILIWIAARKQWGVFRTTKISGHLWRAGLGFCAMQLWFHSLAILPLTLATALSFTSPVFGTIFAIWILKEKAGIRRWMAIGLSFVGVLIILRPDAAMMNLNAFTVLLSAAIMALSGIVVKTLTKTQTPETIVLYMGMLMTPLSAPLGLYHWQSFHTPEALLITVIAFTSTLSHLLLTRAYVHADMVTLLPFDFMRLLFTAILAYAFFGEVIDRTTLLGAMVIMASAVYIAHREAIRRRNPVNRAQEAELLDDFSNPSP